MSPGPGKAVGWGEPARSAAVDAALLNGTAAHALDFDDAALTMPLHVSAVVLPAVLAVAPVDTEPELLLTALEIGHIAARALADVLPMSTHYGRGWHATATVGRVAATVGCARVLGFSPAQSAQSVGLVASTASGSLANFGYGAKPLHAGLAARDAVTAVGLVAAGLTANPDELDDPRGFLARYGAPQGADITSRLQHWSEHWPDDNAIKRYPSCFGTHRAIHAATLLHREGLSSADIERVEVQADPFTLRPLLNGEPATADQAKFSMRHTTARALLTGHVRLDDFSEAALADPAWSDLAHRIDVVARPLPVSGHERYARVIVQTAAGERERTVTFTGSEASTDTAEVDAKFVDCLTHAGRSRPDASAALHRLRSVLTATTVAPLLNVLKGADPDD